MLDKRIDEIRADTRETRSMLEKMRDYQLAQDARAEKDRNRLIEHEKDCITSRTDIIQAIKDIAKDVARNAKDLAEHRKTEVWHRILAGLIIVTSLTIFGVINWDRVALIASNIPN